MRALRTVVLHHLIVHIVGHRIVKIDLVLIEPRAHPYLTPLAGSHCRNPGTLTRLAVSRFPLYVPRIALSTAFTTYTTPIPRPTTPKYDATKTGRTVDDICDWNAIVVTIGQFLLPIIRPTPKLTMNRIR